VCSLTPPDEPQSAHRERRAERGLVEALPEALEAPGARLFDHVSAGLRSEGRQHEIAHRVPSSVGERYESASATWAVPTSFAPASNAIVLATRATLARPRADSGNRSTARLNSSFASRDRRSGSSRARSRAAVTRSRTASDRSPGAPSSSQARGRGTVTTRSNRSSSARESLSRYAANRATEHEHSAAGSPCAPHGQRFIVATSWKRAGKTILPPTRAIETAPSSSGCRNASSALRGNSTNSSRNSTPWCAKLARSEEH